MLAKFIKVLNTRCKTSQSSIPTSFPELIRPGEAALAVMEKKVSFLSVVSNINFVGFVFPIKKVLFFYFLASQILKIGGPVERSMRGCALLGKTFTFLIISSRKMMPIRSQNTQIFS